MINIKIKLYKKLLTLMNLLNKIKKFHLVQKKLKYKVKKNKFKIYNKLMIKTIFKLKN